VCVRADAARNLENLLATGARMLAADPGVTLAAIAAEAGLDRRTLYRRFASREELLSAIYAARLDAIEGAIAEARLVEAPAAVALHRYVEGIIGVNRRWPVDLVRMLEGDAIRERREVSIGKVDAFVQRAIAEGLFRAGLPHGWIEALIPQLTHLVARRQPELSPAQAADLVVDMLMNGIGRPDHTASDPA
jgi:AcrR family transcriptional regulator